MHVYKLLFSFILLGESLQVRFPCHMTLDIQLRNKTSVPVFYCGNKIWVRVWVRMN